MATRPQANMRLVTSALALSLLASLVPGRTVLAGSVERQWGDNRYATAADVSRETFPEPISPTVYVATGEGFADALAAGPATHGDGPVLLVRRNSIPTDTAQELKRLKPGRIVIAGGTAVVSDAVQAALGTYGAPVSRRAGANRYGTAAQISRSAFPDPDVPLVYVATGENFADALAAGAATGGRGPVLLVARNGIPTETHNELNRLNPGRIVIAGGTAVISNAIQNALAAYGAPVSRQAGANRFGTAATISRQTFTDPDVSLIFVATAENFPDALAAGPGAIRGAGPVLLVTRNSIPADTHTELTRLNPGRIIIAGGAGVISSTVEQALAKYLAPTPEGASDTFERSSSVGWGTADSGGTWARTLGPAVDFSVASGSARSTHRLAGSTRQMEIRPVDLPINQRVVMDLQPIQTMGTGNDVLVYAITRRVSGVDHYRLQIRFSGAGHVSLLPQKVINRVATGIGSQVAPALSGWDSGDAVRVKFEAIGTSPTTLRAKVWHSGSPEPAAWAFSRTDADSRLQHAGSSVAIRSFLVTSYSGSLPAVVRIHRFEIGQAN